MSRQHTAFLQISHPLLHLLLYDQGSFMVRVVRQDPLVVIWLQEGFIQNIDPDIVPVFGNGYGKGNIKIPVKFLFRKTLHPAKIPVVFCVIGEPDFSHFRLRQDMCLDFCIHTISVNLYFFFHSSYFFLLFSQNPGQNMDDRKYCILTAEKPFPSDVFSDSPASHTPDFAAYS